MSSEAPKLTSAGNFQSQKAETSVHLTPAEMRVAKPISMPDPGNIGSVNSTQSSKKPSK